MKEFVPTPDFTMNDFEQNFCLFRFKESSDSIRLEYYNLRFPTIQYYIILTGEQLTYFRHTAAYILSRFNPTYCHDGRRIHHYDVCPLPASTKRSSTKRYGTTKTKKPSHRPRTTAPQKRSSHKKI